MSITTTDLSQEAKDKAIALEEFLQETFTKSEFIKDFFDDLYYKFNTQVDEFLASDSEYNYRLRIANEVDSIIERLLAGEENIIKSLRLDREYYIDILDKIRLKIFEQCGNEIQKTIIAELQKEIEELTIELKYVRSLL
jgi:hypothetical protein